jgi:hypothetical protein
VVRDIQKKRGMDRKMRIIEKEREVPMVCQSRFDVVCTGLLASEREALGFGTSRSTSDSDQLRVIMNLTGCEADRTPTEMEVAMGTILNCDASRGCDCCNFAGGITVPEGL